MATLSIARRYARALLDVTSETHSADTALAQLTSLTQAYTQSVELREVATNPAYTREQREAVLQGLMTALGIQEPGLVNLLRLLLDRSRLAHLVDLHRVFRDLVDARAGRVRGRVTSAQPLSPELLQKLEQSLKHITQREVVLEGRVDPLLLGGVSTQLGSLVFDGSLRTQLEDMRQTLGRDNQAG